MQEEDPLASLRHLQSNLDELWGNVNGIHESVRQLSLVIQAQQERATYMEAAIAADRSQLERFSHWMTDAQAQLSDHDEKFAFTDVYVQGLQDKAENMEKQLEQFGAVSQDARCIADASMETLQEHAAQFAKSQDFMQNLQRRHEESEVELQHVSAVHDETASSLRRALSLAIEQAGAQKIRLQEQSDSLALLEGKHDETATMLLKLQGDSQQSFVQTQDLDDKMQDTASTVADMHIRLKSVCAEANADRSRLDNALNQLTALCDDNQRVSDKLQRVCADVASFRVDSAESKVNMGHVAEMVASLNDAHHASDKEVRDVRAILGVPRNRAPVVENGHTDTGVPLLPYRGTGENGTSVRRTRNVYQR